MVALRLREGAVNCLRGERRAVAYRLLLDVAGDCLCDFDAADALVDLVRDRDVLGDDFAFRGGTNGHVERRRLDLAFIDSNLAPPYGQRLA